MKRTKSKLLVVAAIVLCCALAMGGTLAYYTADATAHNVITTGNVDIEIREDFDPETAKGIAPGTTVPKVVAVANTSTTAEGDAWVRVEVQVTASAQGKELPANIEVNGKLQPVAMIDCNTEYWVDGQDGYYYYKTPVAPGETTQPLFKNVRLNPLMGNEYQQSQIDVDVFAQAVQAKNNPAPQNDATKVVGWPQKPQV